MKKFISLFIVLVLVLTGCQGKPVEEKTPEFQTFIDSADRTVELPLKIERIAASGPVSQMYLFSLCPELMVGIANKWSEDAKEYIPPQYLDLPVLGQFYGSGTMNMEEIVKAAPQVIIDIGEAKSSIVEDMDAIMEQVQIPTIHIEANNLTSPQVFRTLGQLLNCQNKSEELASFIENTLEVVDKTIENQEKTNIIYLLGDKGLQTLAKTSYQSEVLDKIGNNVAVVEKPSSKGTGNDIDFEQLLLWDPEVILFAPNSIYKEIEGDENWHNLQAIAQNRYYQVPGLPYNWIASPPSINSYLGMLWLTNLLYPEQKNFDLYEMVAQYYQLFYGYTLSHEAFAALVNE